MAVGASHLVLWDRMVGELGKLHFYLRMTDGTELFLVVATDFLLRPFVQFVAVKAADIIQRMHTGVPACQVWCGGGRMAFQANHRLGLARERGER